MGGVRVEVLDNRLLQYVIFEVTVINSDMINSAICGRN